MMRSRAASMLTLLALSVFVQLTRALPDTNELVDSQIFVKTEIGEMVRVEISLNETIETLKDEIMILESVPPAHQLLAFRGALLDDNKKRLSDYKIEASSEVTLVANANDDDEEEAVSIDIKTQEGKTHSLRIHPIKYVSSLKDKLTKLTGIPKDDQRLVLNGKQLKDNVRLAKYNIGEGTALRLAPPLKMCRGVHEIRVRALSGASATIEIDLADTVMRLKQRIANEMGIAPSLQRLVSEHRQLDDEDHLCDFGMQAGSIVDMVLYAANVKSPASVPKSTTTSAPFRGSIFREAGEGTQAGRSVSATEDTRNWVFQDLLPYSIADMFDPLAHMKLDPIYEIWFREAAQEMKANGAPGKLDPDTYKLLCALNKMSAVVAGHGADVAKSSMQLGAAGTSSEHLGANINNYAPDAFTDSEIARLFERADWVRKQLAHDSSTGEGNLGFAKQKGLNLELLYAYKEALAGIPLADEHRSQVGEKENCAICWESLESEPAVRLPCKHLYHVDCVLQWSGEQHRYQHKSSSCPQCRQACRLPYGLSKIGDDF